MSHNKKKEDNYVECNEFHRKMAYGNMYANSQQRLCGIFLFVSLLILMCGGRRGWRNVLGVVEEYWSVAIILKNRCPSALLPLLLISRTKAGLHYTAGHWTRYIRRNKTILVCVCVFPVVLGRAWGLSSGLRDCPATGLVPTTVSVWRCAHQGVY